MKVPELDEQVGLNPTSPQAPQFAPPVQAAFGENVAQAAERVGQAVQGAGAQLMGRLLERDRMQKEQQALDAYNSYGQDLQDLQHKADPNTGQPVLDPKTGKPMGLLDRQLGQANGITPEFDVKAAALRQKYLDGLQTPSQRELFMQMAARHAGAAREQVLAHESREGSMAYDVSVKASLDQVAQSAVNIADPKALNSSIDAALKINSTALSHKGVSDAGVLAQQNAALAAGIAEKPINEQLANGSWKAAQALLEAVRGRIPSDVAAHLESNISGRAFDDTRQSVWEALSAAPDMRMQDGKTFDVEKARALIMDPKHLTLADPVTGKPMETKQREQVVDFVKGMAGEQHMQQDRQESAAFAQFTSDAVAARAGGTSYADALKLAADPKYGFDGKNALRAQAELKRMFTEADVKSDVDTYLGLSKGIMDGTITKPDLIRDAFNDGQLSKKDFLALSKNLMDGKSQAMAVELEKIRADVKAKLPDAQTQGAYMASLLQQKLEKGITDPTELDKLHLENLKTAPTGASGFFGRIKDMAGGQAYYKTAEAVEKNQELVKAIGDTGKAVQLAQRVGGPDALAPGSPSAAAVLALIKAGWRPEEIGLQHVQAVAANPGKKIPPPARAAAR